MKLQRIDRIVREVLCHYLYIKAYYPVNAEFTDFKISHICAFGNVIEFDIFFNITNESLKGTITNGSDIEVTDNNGTVIEFGSIEYFNYCGLETIIYNSYLG